jgi:hypothetical protein
MLVFNVEELLLTTAQSPIQKTIPCQPNITAFSVFSWLPSISGGHLLHIQPEDVPCHDESNPLNMASLLTITEESVKALCMTECSKHTRITCTGCKGVAAVLSIIRYYSKFSWMD